MTASVAALALVLSWAAPLAAEDEPQPGSPAVTNAEPRRLDLEDYRRRMAERGADPDGADVLARLAKLDRDATELDPAQAPEGPGWDGVVSLRVPVAGRPTQVLYRPGFGKEQMAGLFARGTDGSLTPLKVAEDGGLRPVRPAAAPGSGPEAARGAARLKGALASGAAFDGGAGLRDVPAALSPVALPPAPAAPKPAAPPAADLALAGWRVDGTKVKDASGKEVGHRFELAGRKLLFVHAGNAGGRADGAPWQDYSLDGRRLGRYEEVTERAAGRGAPKDLFSGSPELRFRLEGGKLLAPDGSKVGFVPKDARYGDETVVFYYGENRSGADGGSPWLVYSTAGQRLGDYEAVRARSVVDHDGKTQTRVLAPAGTLYRALDGTLYEPGSKGGAPRPFFDAAETATLKQLDKLSAVKAMPEGSVTERLLKKLALAQAEKALDARFAEKFPIVKDADLARHLPEQLRSLSQGSLDALAPRRSELEAVRGRYRAEYERLRDEYDALKAGGTDGDALLRAADRRNRAGEKVEGLDGALRALSDRSGVGERLAELRRLRQDGGADAALSGPGRAALDYTRRMERLQATAPEFDALAARVGESKALLARLPEGSDAWRRAAAADARLSRRRDALVTERQGLRRELEADLSWARGTRLAVERLAAAEGAGNASERAYWERALRENWLRAELQGGQTLEQLRGQYSGSEWRRWEPTLGYLEGVQASYQWDWALADRRAGFDAGLSVLMDPSVDPAVKRRLLRQ
ncbi:MAG: hypothetical protein HY928_00990 [Elusimicrobia bacterium]|nr:hypothetical protein [Elusimicrobiota bacterium]